MNLTPDLAERIAEWLVRSRRDNPAELCIDESREFDLLVLRLKQAAQAERRWERYLEEGR